MSHSSSEDEEQMTPLIFQTMQSSPSRNGHTHSINDQSPELMSTYDKLVLKKQQHEASLKFAQMQQGFMSHLINIGLAFEDKQEKVKAIIDGVQERSQLQGAHLSIAQILSVSFKEYLFSLDDFWISKICSAFVEKWVLNNSQSDNNKSKSQRSFHSNDKSQDQHSIGVKNFVNDVTKSQNFKNSTITDTQQQINQQPVMSRFQSPTISQLQKMRRQNEQMIENVDNKSYRGNREKSQSAHSNHINQAITKQDKSRDGSKSARYHQTSPNSNEHSRPISTHKQRSPPDPKLFERLYEESKIKKQFKEQVEEIKILNELKECTFQPVISAAQQYHISIASPMQTPKDNGSGSKPANGNIGDNMSNISAIDYASSSGIPPSRDEFFNNLAKQGGKTLKAQELEKIKEMQELRECTFHPQLQSKSLVRQSQYNEETQDNQLVPVWEKLYKEHNEALEYKQLKQLQKEQQELKQCTFIPQINNKRKSIHLTCPGSDDEEYQPDPYTRLYQKHNEYQAIKKQKEIEQKQREIESCTFSPQRITKSRDKKYASINQKSQDRFEKLYKDGSMKMQERNFDNSKQFESSQSQVLSRNQTYSQKQSQQSLKSARDRSNKTKQSNIQTQIIDKSDSTNANNIEPSGVQNTNQQKLSSMIYELTNHPQSTKSKTINIQNDFMQRNQQFIEKKNQKLQQLQNQTLLQHQQKVQTAKKNQVNTASQKSMRTLTSPTSNSKLAQSIRNETQKQSSLKTYTTLQTQSSKQQLQHQQQLQQQEMSNSIPPPLVDNDQSTKSISVYNNQAQQLQVVGIKNHIPTANMQINDNQATSDFCDQQYQERRQALEKLNQRIQGQNQDQYNYKRAQQTQQEQPQQEQQNAKNSVIYYLQQEISQMNMQAEKITNANKLI